MVFLLQNVYASSLNHSVVLCVAISLIAGFKDAGFNSC